MGKQSVLVLVLVLLTFVSALDNFSEGWDQFSNDSGGSEIIIENASNEETVSEVKNSPSLEDTLKEGLLEERTDDSGNYTEDFYLALGVAVIAIILFLFFFYLFFRKPHNAWRRKYS